MTASSSATSKVGRFDRLIPWYFVLFFLVVAAVDTTMITLALRTNTGLVTEDAYKKGLAFNRLIDEAETQKRSGLSEKPLFENGRLTWTLTEKEGAALKGATVTARLYRPATSGSDFDLALQETGDGVYEGQPTFPVAGRWIARLEADWTDSSGKPQNYKAAIELTVPMPSLR